MIHPAGATIPILGQIAAPALGNHGAVWGISLVAHWLRDNAEWTFFRWLAGGSSGLAKPGAALCLALIACRICPNPGVE